MMPEEWYPKHPPIYDIKKTYAENAAEGPFFDGEIPKRAKPKKLFDFLGYKVNSPIGVPAGPLLNSKWIELAGKLGFDIPTYKTIRSSAHPGHALPNVIYIDGSGRQIENPGPLSELSITNSFGMPSKSPDFLIQDIDRANRSLGAGQVMIVSVVGTPNQGMSFAEDFVRTAILAKEAGAKIIEANFSCPNVEKSDGILYMNPETVHEYSRLISRAIHPIPFLIKVGAFPDKHLLRSTLLAAARGGCAGVCGINSVSMQVTTFDGKAALGESRKTSGVCGGAIRKEALHFLQEAHQIIENEKLGLILMGCGGIMLPSHFDEFFKAGAHIAMTATGMMWDPYLAMRYHAHSITHS